MAVKKISKDPHARDELDRAVRAIVWDERACQFGSSERKQVAGWLFATDLIVEELRRHYPVAAQRDLILDYVNARLYEKITGQEVASNANAWNMDGLWDPTAQTSFCGWARRTAMSLAKWNARRVLKRREIAESTLNENQDDEDGSVTNSAVERRSMVDIVGSASSTVFDLYPNLQVPRPVGVDRAWLMNAINDNPPVQPHTLVAMLQERGWWHYSLNQLDEVTAIVLLLAPLPNKSLPLLSMFPEARALADTADTQCLITEYGLSQSLYPKRANMVALKRAVIARAERDHTIEWSVLTRLGTMTAGLVAGNMDWGIPVGNHRQGRWPVTMQIA